MNAWPPPKAGGSDYQRAINLFLDEFRRANDRGRRMLVQDPIGPPGDMEGLVAVAVSALCRKVGIETPAWTSQTYSPEPFLPGRPFF